MPYPKTLIHINPDSYQPLSILLCFTWIGGRPHSPILARLSICDGWSPATGYAKDLGVRILTSVSSASSLKTIPMIIYHSVANKYYVLASTVMLVYDHLLTFEVGAVLVIICPQAMLI